MRGSGWTACAVILSAVIVAALPSGGQASQLVPPAVGAQGASLGGTADCNPFFAGRHALDQAIFGAQVTYRLGKSE